MIIKYITRDREDPRGRPKVFFACRPEDFDEAFPLLTKDILDVTNCAVWYDSEAYGRELSSDGMQEGIEISLEDALKDMQLVVLGVTSAFLHTPCEAKDRVLPLALEHHVPVLPIMLEKGLRGEFNKTCAKIQCVDRYVTDPTATPYEDVLKTFLNSVLVGEELAQRVRNAFDAYVFLSYRKKDREYAQRLMQLIHSNREYRDFAIWYDEYLVPGEKFNDAILQAFQKSSLFAMAVTPHLEEAGNYVMRVEYPLAKDRLAENRRRRENGFDIVPVEMYNPPEKTGDKPWRLNPDNLLHKEFKYETIDDLQNEHRRPELNKAFIDALDRIAKKEHDGSVEHTFLIGLAYLEGIDVEVDKKRAVGLITEASEAEEPCLEATAKLADMYLNGEGVDRNPAEAIRRQKMLADQYKAAYEKNHNPDEHKGYGTGYFKALRKLSEMCRETGDLRAAMDAAEQALAFSDELEAEVGIREQERDKALILNRLGGLYSDIGDYATAEKRFLQACRIYERQALEIGTHRVRRDLSISYERLGDIYRKKKNYSTAEEYYRKAEEIRRALNEKQQTATSRRDLSAVMTKLGNVRKAAGSYEEAEEYYSRALDADRSLAKELRTPQAYDDLGVSLVKCGDMAKTKGDLTKAEAQYEEACALFRRNAEGTGYFSYREHLAAGCEKLASIKKKLGQKDKAGALYEEAVKLRREQNDTVNTVASRHALASACYSAGAFSGSRELMMTARDLWSELSIEHHEYSKYLEMAEKLLR